jgi:hypothetical protein
MFTRRSFTASAAAAALPMPALAAENPRDLLGRWHTADSLAGILIPREKWHPFPDSSDRAGWEAVPASVRAALVAEPAKFSAKPWPELPATLLLEFKRVGNRSHYEGPWFERRKRIAALGIAEALENKGRFTDPLVDAIWSICEETFWGLPAHIGAQKAGVGLPDIAEPIVDLFAAETGALLAWVLYLAGGALDRVSPLIRERLHLEVERRILVPNLERDFSWMKVGMNWNPWIDSNWITCALLMERDEARRRASVAKAIRSLENFLNLYHDDGGCDEGPSYWTRAGGSLFDCLELLDSASAGAIRIWDQPLVGEMGRYIYRAHIANDWFINFADASPKVTVSGELIYRYGKRIGDPRLAAFGAWASNRHNPEGLVWECIGRELPGIFALGEIRSAKAAPPLARDAWLGGIQVMAAREREGSPAGFYLAAQGGHNAEAHNHNDVGNFIVFLDGEPVLVDAGVETYTAKTFGPNRYDIWTMQSAYHNLPTIGGVMQAAGREFAARETAWRSDDRAAEFSLDIAKAYPVQANLESWKRVLRLDRAKGRVEVLDSYALSKAAPEITLTLLTPCRVTTAAGSVSLAAARPVAIRFAPATLKPVVEEVPIEDTHLRAVWGERLYRILLRAASPPQKGEFRLYFERS